VIFKEALQTFLSGDLELAQLKAVLGDDLRQDPYVGDTYLEVIQDTHFRGLLPDDTFSELRSVISGTGTGTMLIAPPVSAANETPQTADAPVGLGSKIGGQYVLMQELGRGGMGVVYKALDIKAKAANDRNPYVAIKLLSEEFKNHPDSLIALQREAKKSQMLSHPNIVNVFVFSFDAQVAWIVMEFLDGKPLSDLLDEPLSHEDALSYIKQMCSALQHAHNIKPQPVVHYDLKPANAFLTRNGVVKLLDFGIARVAPTGREDDESDKTLFNPASLGALTPSYASYEMIRGVDPDPRDDIYSLACVAYELLTGQHPYERTSAVNAQAKRLKVKPVKGLTRGQNKALRNALAFERADRTASVEDFIRELLPEETRSSRKILWGGLVASLLLIAASSVIWLPAALDDWRVYSTGQNLSSMSDPELAVALKDIQSLSSADSAGIFQDENNVTRVVEFYEAQIAEVFNPQRGAYDYPAAEIILRELQELLPGSLAAEQAEVTLVRSKADEMARLYGVHDIAIEQQLLISEDGVDNLASVLGAIRLLDSRDLKLDDSNIVVQYTSGVEEAIRRQDYDRADRVAGVGTGLVAGDRARSELESAASVIARARLGEIVTLRGNYDSLDAFNAAITAGDLDSAGQIFGDFGPAGVPGQLQIEAADRLAGEYHAEAQRQIAGNPNRAQALVALGLALNPTADVAAKLDELSALVRGGQAEQNEAEIVRLRRNLGNRLSASDFILSDVGWSADTLMRLVRLRVDTSTDRQQVIDRVVRAGEQLIAAGSKSEAYNIASAAGASFGDAREIRDLIDRVNKMGGRQATPQPAATESAPTVSAQVDELGKLLSADSLTETRTSINSRLRMIQRAGGNIDTALVRVIDASMGRAAMFEASGQSAAADAHRKLAETYRARLAPSTDSPEVARQKFDSAIAAGDMDTARRHFVDLQASLPATDDFLMQDGREILITGYIDLAQARSLKDDFDAADELLIRALEIAPDDTRILAKQKRIVQFRQSAGQ
jgi:serine/threonine protein kinase